MPRKKGGGTATICASAPVGPDAFDSLFSDLSSAVESSAKSILIDLTEAQSIDSACLALIVAASRDLTDGRTLTVNASQRIARAFGDWRLDTVLDLAINEAPA